MQYKYYDSLTPKKFQTQLSAGVGLGGENFACRLHCTIDDNWDACAVNFKFKEAMMEKVTTEDNRRFSAISQYLCS
jgi:hypothetical protein